eukprot:6172099-Pleurochrysis_carterae.AAC.1
MSVQRPATTYTSETGALRRHTKLCAFQLAHIGVKMTDRSGAVHAKRSFHRPRAGQQNASV